MLNLLRCWYNEPMICSKCGKELVEGAQFCAFCGQPAPKAEPDDDRALVRPKKGRILGGVAAGMAEAFGIPLMVMRVMWAVLSVVTVGLVAIIYVVLCFVIPEGSE